MPSDARRPDANPGQEIASAPRRGRRRAIGVALLAALAASAALGIVLNRRPVASLPQSQPDGWTEIEESTGPLASAETTRHPEHDDPRAETSPLVKEETGSPNKVDVVGRWPEQRQEGRAAKSFLLEMLTDVETWFDSVPAYTATFHKQERVKGELLQGQTFAIKVRQDPFAIYFRSISPEAGKELIFARGHFKDQVVAHSTGLARLLAPRLQVAPDHPLLMAQSRHPVTDAGLGNLIRRLIHYRRQDLEEAEAETVLDRYQSSDGRKWLRSTHIHHDASNGRPFARTEILYQPDTGLPVQFVGYDWPPQGQTEPVLGERFRYDHLELDATISSKDFDPTNPEYAFHRF